MKKRDGTPRAAIDWVLVKQRIEAVGEALEKNFTPPQAQRDAILRTRAQALALEPQQPLAADAVIEILEFGLAHERYAVETGCVHEVYVLKELTPLPCTPPFVLGIVNVHGRIMSVLDIKKFFDLPEKGIGDLNKLIILRNETMEFGILADQIFGASWLSLADLQPTLPILTGVRADYLKGVTKSRLVVLDAKKLLTDRRIIINEEVTS